VRIGTILVPIDFSRCSLGGLRYAIQFAEIFSARIIVLHALEIGPLLGADGYGANEMFRYGELAKAGAEKKMRSFLRTVKFGRVEFETQIVIGRPVDAICDVGNEKGADLIVTATHGRTGLSHMLIGSTAEVVVRHAPCPVLVVPSHPGERRKRLQSIARRAEPLRFRRLVTPAMKQKPLEREHLSKRFRKLTQHPFPERRKINKFRESHVGSMR
jgi:nucleotide-binding universal stress UspA family protein